MLGGRGEFEVFLSSLNFLSFVRETCVLFMLKATEDKSHGLGGCGMVGICLESEAKSAAAPTKRGRVGPGAWGRGTPRGDHLGPAQALSPPHSPEGETQLHRGGVPDAQNSWPPVGGHPPEKGLQRRPPQTLLSDTTSRAGLTWLVRRSPLKGSTGGTPALKLPNKSPPCSVPQFLPGTRGRASKRCARTRGSGRTASTI